MNHLGRAILTATHSQNVQQAPADGGRIQHGVVKDGTWIGLGDGSEDDLTATAQTFIGNTGAYFDGEGEQAIPSLARISTFAIGFAYAPRGEERTLLIPTEIGWGALFEHGFEDMPLDANDQPMNPGEVYMLHRSAPINGEYAQAVYDAGIRYLNDGPTPNDGKGTTEVGFQGAQTKLQTKAGWLIVEDDTARKLSIYFPSGVLALVIDANTGFVNISGANGSNVDGLVRKSDLQAALNSLAGLVQAGGGVVPPTATASTKSFTG